MKNKGLSITAFILSILAVIMAVMDAFGVSVWLSANSWLIIAAILAVWAVYTDENK